GPVHHAAHGRGHRRAADQLALGRAIGGGLARPSRTVPPVAGASSSAPASAPRPAWRGPTRSAGVLAAPTTPSANSLSAVSEAGLREGSSTSAKRLSSPRISGTIVSAPATPLVIPWPLSPVCR